MNRAGCFRREYLLKAHAFYEKYGGRAIILARFVPIVRTFAPFVAGVGTMHYAKFFAYNVYGRHLVGGFVRRRGLLFREPALCQGEFEGRHLGDNHCVGAADRVGIRQSAARKAKSGSLAYPRIKRGRPFLDPFSEGQLGPRRDFAPGILKKPTRKWSCCKLDNFRSADRNALNSSRKESFVCEAWHGDCFHSCRCVSRCADFIDRISNNQLKTFNYPCVKANPYWRR